MLQTASRTDRQATCLGNTAQRAASRGKKHSESANIRLAAIWTLSYFTPKLSDCRIWRRYLKQQLQLEEFSTLVLTLNLDLYVCKLHSDNDETVQTHPKYISRISALYVKNCFLILNLFHRRLKYD